jgi:hypothetical protein
MQPLRSTALQRGIVLAARSIVFATNPQCDAKVELQF